MGPQIKVSLWSVFQLQIKQKNYNNLENSNYKMRKTPNGEIILGFGKVNYKSKFWDTPKYHL